MDISGGIQASLAGRYAIALFELADEQKQLDTVGESLAALKQALAESDDFRTLTTSPLIGREQAVAAVGASAGAMALDPITTNFLGVLAKNRRLGQLGNVIRAFNLLAARHRGEISAEVTSAMRSTRARWTRSGRTSAPATAPTSRSSSTSTPPYWAGSSSRSAAA